ncbi:MAG: CHASE2 domain-containing protein [Candidatus Sericytochromatia bacterium]
MATTSFRYRVPLALGLVLALLWSALSAWGPLVLAEWAAYGALFTWRGELTPPAEVVIVAIDEPTMEALETWPIPRSLYGHLIDGLLGSGASVVGLDITFPQAQFPENDEAFEAALRRHPGKVVLAANFQPVANGTHQGEQLVLPYKPFREAAAFGVVNLDFDENGGIHRFRPVREGVDPEDLGALKDYESFDVAIARRHAPDRLPDWAEAEEQRLINYTGPAGHVETVSMATVLEAVFHGDRELLSRFDGKIVLLGATAVRLQDQYLTPFAAATYMPGVEIHANVLGTLLRDDPVREVPWGAQLLYMLAIGALAGWGFSRIRPWWGLAALVAGAAAHWGLALGLFAGARLWLDVAAPLGLLAAAYVGAVVLHFLRAETSRRFYRQTFERYVAPDIVAELLSNPGMAPKLGGEKREISVLFSDIRSFTTISEKLSPEEVVEFLNAYLTAMAEVIHANQGCIDKYIGDAILALWGNVKPLTPEQHAQLAVRTALAMKARVEALRPEWLARGYPHIEIGVGVNTGEAVVGNIGSPQKMEFAVIGDSINVASRLEGLTKQYDGAVVISDRTRELIGPGFRCTYLDTIKVKGREQPVAIYRVDGEGFAEKIVPATGTATESGTKA